MNSPRYFRKVIRISAADSPNVAIGLMERQAGRDPSYREEIPGVLSLAEYDYRRATWDRVRQCIGLDGDFWEGAEQLLFPPEWLNRAEERARELDLRTGQGEMNPRRARAIGCDPGEGGANTAWAVVDEWGLIALESYPTPQTADIPNRTLALMNEHRVPAEYVGFDRGGGGKQHADALRAKGHEVRTIAFGESILADVKRGTVREPYAERLEQREDRYTYVNRRAEMYGELSLLLDPVNERGFALPATDGRLYGPAYGELRRQLALIPRWYDEEGRLWLPPKNKKDPNSKVKTLTEILGKSPDEADALVLAVHTMFHRPKKPRVGIY